uniref:Uncharacterized protein n=1 Tax=Picea glauca TaxID=3330 RepID=A0A101LTC6_PICGL|nr:hypothetical protein ABT39_MTgene4062 [Picea glauca]KUM45106.1 hypothetical protein ABT39_MTgene4077 [Picea glauca]
MLEIVITSEIFISRPICELVNLFVSCLLAEVCKCKLQVYSNLVGVVKKGVINGVDLYLFEFS